MKAKKTLILVSLFLLFFSCEEKIGSNSEKELNRTNLAMAPIDEEPDGPTVPIDEEAPPQPSLDDITALSDPKIDNNAVELTELRTEVSKTFLLPSGNHMLVVLPKKMLGSDLPINSIAYSDAGPDQSNPLDVGYNGSYVSRILYRISLGANLEPWQNVESADFSYKGSGFKIHLYNPTSSNPSFNELKTRQIHTFNFPTQPTTLSYSFTNLIRTSVSNGESFFSLSLINDNETDVSKVDVRADVSIYLTLEKLDVNDYSINISDLSNLGLGSVLKHFRAELNNFPSNYTTKWYKQDSENLFSYSEADFVIEGPESSALQGDAHLQNGIYGDMDYYVVFEAFGIKSTALKVYSIAYLKGEGSPDLEERN